MAKVLKLGQFQQEFDRYFFTYWQQQKKKLLAIDDNFRPVLAQIIKLAGKGKRLRPYFCYLGYLGYGGIKTDKVFPAAMAIELFHLFALIHDDIMDKADKRRGITTIHRAFGLSAGILAGDLVLCLAQDLMPDNLYWQKLKQEVIIGQFLDVNVRKKTEKEIWKIMELKTARYTVLRPLQIGAFLTGACQKNIEKIADFAIPTGIAFQLQDDLLDKDKEKSLNLVKLKGKKYCRGKISRLVVQIKKSLENVTIKPQVKESLSQLVDYLVARKK